LHPTKKHPLLWIFWSSNMAISATYNYVRSRQLEGTYPGDRSLGTWITTAQRVTRGWGAPDENEWAPSQEDRTWPYSEPPGLDAKAKKNRIQYYQRIRSAIDCRKTLHQLGAIVAAFEITEQWFNAPGGIINLPESDAPLVGSHAVTLVRSKTNKREFTFMNSWGKDWGSRGLGILTYEFFDRHLIEAWIPSGPYHYPWGSDHQGIIESERGLRDYLGGVLHLKEIYDATNDENVAWAFGVRRGEFFDVEEFFVMPKYRGHGYAHRLADMLLKSSQKLGLEMRLWVPFADCEQDNLPGVEKVASMLGVELMPSDVRWAALKAVAPQKKAITNTSPRNGEINQRAADCLTKVSLPHRPAQARPSALALGTAAVAASLALPGAKAHSPQAAPSERVATEHAGVLVSDEEVERTAQDTLDKFAPLYKKLATESTEGDPEQKAAEIPEQMFEDATEKAFEKYSELYERLS
jgi:GNAT superfamily N-acetyltransferase